MTSDNKPTVNWTDFRDLTAVVIAIFIAFFGIYGMINGETSIIVNPETNMLANVSADVEKNEMLHGLMQYCKAAGLIFFLAGVVYIMLGYKDQTESDPTRPNDWK